MRLARCSAGMVAALILVLAAACGSNERLQTLWSAPHFDLVDETGRPFSSEALAGRVWLADFIYTNCPDECPLYLSPKMLALQGEIKAHNLAGQVDLLSFTVDPQRDTPPVLADYAARYTADARVWRFLTGPEATLAPLLQTGFKVGTALPADSVMTPDQSATNVASTGSETLLHTTYFLLVDRRGMIRALYDGEQVEVSEMLRGMQLLLAEQG